MLAAIDSSKNSPKKMQALLNKIKVHKPVNGEEQKYSAEFYSEDGSKHLITISESDLMDDSGKALVKDQTTQGIKVLARLYSRFLKQDEQRRGLQVKAKTILNAEGRDWNSEPRKVYTHLFGCQQHRTDKRKVGETKFMEELSSFFENKEIS